jgi:2C-methyl-D-erythritol 2,4-cyclodiphosphate synthase
MMVMEWGNEPKFINWEDCPKYRTLKLSQLLDDQNDIIKTKMYLKVNLDIDISYEEANFLKETFMQNKNIRELSLIQDKTNVDMATEEGVGTNFESVDHIVATSLVSVESEQFDKNVLLGIYNGL